MDTVRIGIIGIGNMGTNHAKRIVNGEVPGAELTAVCDRNPQRLTWVKENLAGDVSTFEKADELYKSGVVDAVLIATPHYDHPPLSIKAFEAGLHVLSEKPAGVYTKQVREMNDAADKSDRVFGMMFNQRQRPLHQKVRDLVQSGELGALMRTNWVVSAWYRSQAYYDSGDWRATWRGEGGGVLLNQCPHNLDLWQWMCGMPAKVRAFCSFGKYHDIEVEDDVTAYVEYPNGATGLFVTSTGEAPGNNSLEIVGERGKLIMEDGSLTFWRTRENIKEYTAQTKVRFGKPECWKCDIPISGTGEEHLGVLKNWVNAIRNGEKLTAPGQEGIKSLELSNAMLLSEWTNDWVELPVDEDVFYNYLQERVENSRYTKKTSSESDAPADMDSSFV